MEDNYNDLIPNGRILHGPSFKAVLLRQKAGYTVRIACPALRKESKSHQM